jgi:hypothetical protein
MASQFVYLRYAGDLVSYEVDGFAIILARGNNYLNYRRVVGFRVLSPSTGKRCEWEIEVWYKSGKFYNYTKTRCGRRAIVGVVFDKDGKKFTVYLCERHFIEFLNNAVRYVKDVMERIYDRVMHMVYNMDPTYDPDLDGIQFVVQGGRSGQ